MSSSNITDDVIATYNALLWDSVLFVRCWCITMFILGCIGHSFSIYVFTRPALYNNPCSRYFLASAITGYLVVFVNIPVRLLQLGFKLNFFVVSMEVCKILTFLFCTIRVLPCWFIALASCDRFFCSSRSATLRRWSSIRVSKYLISLTILFIGLTQLPILISYTSNAQVKTCLAQPNIYQQVITFINVIVWSVIPSSAMLVFCYLTIRHIRQSARNLKQQNNANQQQRRTKFIDRQLIQITLIQSALFVSSSSCGVAGLYVILGLASQSDLVEFARQSLLTNILSLIGFLGPCITFYLCTLSSQLFRNELLKLFYLQRTNVINIGVNA